MNASIHDKKLLGVNGLGRMGKLTLWYHLVSRKFDGIVANAGRDVGKGIDDFIQAISSDSTYGSLDHFLHGHSGRQCAIEVVDRGNGWLAIDGFMVKFLNRERNPQNLRWKDEGVRVVVDCTGKFLDPSVPANDARGSVAGHLAAGAQKVIVSAPFKSKSASWTDSEACPTLIFGINHASFNPMHHNIISAASCTTTGLAHMIKPLLEDRETSHILTASMSTVHAATNSQSVLDSVPAAGASDLRKNRSVLNNIILSSTGAAKTLEKVIPQTSHFGFMADSIRIPTPSVSLIALNITFSSRLNENGMPFINTEHIKEIYRSAAAGAQQGLLLFSTKQNVSQDLLGFPAAVVIEGQEIHTRTGFLQVPQDVLAAIGVSGMREVNIPVTHAKIMGWYDNEFGSYVNCLGKLTEYVSSQIE